MESKTSAESKLIQKVVAARRAASDAGHIIRYPEALKREVIAFGKIGRLSPEAVAKRLSLSKSIVRRWFKRLSSVPRQSASLQRVQVVQTQTSAPGDAIELAFPSGVRAMVSLNQLRQLLVGES